MNPLYTPVSLSERSAGRKSAVNPGYTLVKRGLGGICAGGLGLDRSSVAPVADKRLPYPCQIAATVQHLYSSRGGLRISWVHQIAR